MTGIFKTDHAVKISVASKLIFRKFHICFYTDRVKMFRSSFVKKFGKRILKLWPNLELVVVPAEFNRSSEHELIVIEVRSILIISAIQCIILQGVR